MKLFRYRAPSINTVMGVTKYKRRAKRALGISQAQAWTKPSRVKQRIKAKAGLYSPTARAVRQTVNGAVPTPLGLSGSRRR